MISQTNDYIIQDGERLRPGLRWTLTESDAERVRLGYVCITCLEPQEQAFPEGCSLCGFPMRAQQPDRFEHEFEGDEWIGPRTSLSDEWERAHEGSKRRHHRKEKSIWVPGESS